MNNEINKYGHFKSANLEDGDPRMVWLNVNGKSILCCESGVDRDENDVPYLCAGSVETVDIPLYIEKNSYIFLFEDTRDSSTDYDLNDVVLKGERIDDTHVRYTLMACGANDELYLHQTGSAILEGWEIYSVFNSPGRNFINTETINYPYVSDQVSVSPDFSFLNSDYQPLLENRTKEYNIRISRSGEGPHAIMIPANIKWPKERVRIDKAYLEFGNWGRNMIESTDWYLKPVEELVINP